MSTFKISNATTKVGKIVTLKVRMLASGGEGAVKFAIQWDPAVLTFAGVEKGIGAGNAALGTNEHNLGIGQVEVLINPTPVAFVKSRSYIDLCILKFHTAFGVTDVRFADFLHANTVGHITNGSLLNAKWIGGRVNVKK